MDPKRDWRVALPTEERGLKKRSTYRYLAQNRSHPLRVRGLKWHIGNFLCHSKNVASPAGAWIEMA